MEFSGEAFFRDSEDYFFGLDDGADEFAKLIGLNGTYWTWLTQHNQFKTIDEQIERSNFTEDGIRQLNTIINDLADAAAAANYASRRVKMTIDNERDLNIQVAVHPHTQRKVIEFMIDHLRSCDDDECEMRNDAADLVRDGYKVMPRMVESTVWDNSERMQITGMLDQLDAALRDVR